MNCQTNGHEAVNQQAVAQAQPEAQSSSSLQGQRCFVPAVDTFEQGDELLLVADVPGAKADEIDVQYNDGELRIHAPIQNRAGGRSFLLKEYEVGHYARAFRIGDMFDPSHIAANFADGVLTLRLPKHEAVKARKITVKANA